MTSLTLPETIDLEMDGNIAILFINRTEKRNALDMSTIEGLRDFFETLNTKHVRGVVLASRGPNFSAGLDLSELKESDASDGMFHSMSHHKAFNAIQYASVPVVSVLKGAVVGAGLELASATHIRIAEPTAYYALPEGTRGIFLGGGGSVRISRLVGVPRVTDMMMTGRTISASDGYMFGFSQYLVEEGEGVEKAVEVARRASQNADLSTYAIIQALPRIIEMTPEHGLMTEALITGVVQSSPDAKARLADFLVNKANRVKHTG